MKVRNIIAQVREICLDASVNDDQLIRMLSELEARIYRETVSNYENAPAFSPIEDEDSSLMISEEYADVYRYWLLSKIYLNVGDYERYNNFAELYATALDSFRRDHIRQNMPLGTSFKY
ncbi:MAG: hypothetical protein E7575_02975 [Ruminococcaceae bacterium]|nr:hypothetical protein [Oscillospiraceae bacterium]